MVLARIRALYEFETSLKLTPEASNDLLARYPISILKKEISVPRVSTQCVSQMVSAGIAGNDALKACPANAVAIIRYPDPQAVDFPNCAVCQVITTAPGKHMSISGMALKQGSRVDDTSATKLTLPRMRPLGYRYPLIPSNRKAGR